MTDFGWMMTVVWIYLAINLAIWLWVLYQWSMLTIERRCRRRELDIDEQVKKLRDKDYLKTTGFDRLDTSGSRSDRR